MAASISDVDAAIAAQGTEITTLLNGVTTVSNDINTLIQKISQGGNVDLTKELQAIQANTNNIVQAVTIAQKADQVANPPGPSDEGEVPQ